MELFPRKYNNIDNKDNSKQNKHLNRLLINWRFFFKETNTMYKTVNESREKNKVYR